MIFYDYPMAPSPSKVRIFLAEKGIDLPTRVVDLRSREQHTTEFLAINPSGTVPVLVLDSGVALTESLAICHYLEQFHSEPNLLGADLEEQALVLMWNDILTFEGYLPIQEVLRNESAAFAGRPLPGPVSYEQIPALAVRGRKRCTVFFDRLESVLDGAEYLTCGRFTYADIVAFVYLGFAERALGSPPVDSRPALGRWRERIAARKSIDAA